MSEKTSAFLLSLRRLLAQYVCQDLHLPSASVHLTQFFPLIHPPVVLPLAGFLASFLSVAEFQH